MTTKVILLACGSFSPPTPMHFRMFEIARDYLHSMGLSSVVGGVVSPVHDAYGKLGLVSASHRITMLRLALQSSDWVRVSEWECQQEGWTRTRNSLQYHQNYVNSWVNNMNNTFNEEDTSWLPSGLRDLEGSAVRVKLLCGADLLESFSKPGLWDPDDIDAIVGHHGLIVISRNGSNPENFIFNSDQLTKFRHNITIITNWVPNEVSSTMIRRLLSRGESVKYLVDDSVISYCMEHGLYGAHTTKYTLFPPNPNDNSIFLTPSPSDIIMQTPSNFSIDLVPISNIYKTLDEADYISTPKQIKLDFTNPRNPQTDSESFKSNVFCCAETVKTNNTKNKPSRPGQAVKVVTDAAGNHTVIKEVSAKSNRWNKESCTCDAVEDICEDLDLLQVSDSENSSRKSSKSYEDVIKFIFTEHGIRVISDKETVV